MCNNVEDSFVPKTIKLISFPMRLLWLIVYRHLTVYLPGMATTFSIGVLSSLISRFLIHYTNKHIGFCLYISIHINS